MNDIERQIARYAAATDRNDLGRSEATSSGASRQRWILMAAAAFVAIAAAGYAIRLGSDETRLATGTSQHGAEDEIESGTLTCQPQRRSSFNGQVDPTAVVGIDDALQFYLDQTLPQLGATAPDGPTNPDGSSPGAVLLVADASATFGWVEDGQVMVLATLVREQEVWHMASSLACESFLDRHGP